MQSSLVFKHKFQIFMFEGYSRRTSNYPKIIILHNLTHIMSLAYLVAIGVEVVICVKIRSSNVQIYISEKLFSTLQI